MHASQFFSLPSIDQQPDPFKFRFLTCQTWAKTLSMKRAERFHACHPDFPRSSPDPAYHGRGMERLSSTLIPCRRPSSPSYIDGSFPFRHYPFSRLWSSPMPCSCPDELQLTANSSSFPLFPLDGHKLFFDATFCSRIPSLKRGLFSFHRCDFKKFLPSCFSFL